MLEKKREKKPFTCSSEFRSVLDEDLVLEEMKGPPGREFFLVFTMFSSCLFFLLPSLDLVSRLQRLPQ